MSEISRLELRVVTDSIDPARAKLDKLTTAARNAEEEKAKLQKTVADLEAKLKSLAAQTDRNSKVERELFEGGKRLREEKQKLADATTKLQDKSIDLATAEKKLSKEIKNVGDESKAAVVGVDLLSTSSKKAERGADSLGQKTKSAKGELAGVPGVSTAAAGGLSAVGTGGVAAGAGTTAASTAIRGLMASVAPLLAPLAILAATLGAVKKAATQGKAKAGLLRELEASLGGVERSATALKGLKQLQGDLNQPLGELKESFITLVNAGLDPSAEALTGYSNIAKSTGEDITSITESVKDAATGNTDALEQFGIRMKQNGDDLDVTFRGNTETIGSSAQEIQQYLTDLGNTEFAISATSGLSEIESATNRLGIAWDNLFNNIQTGGVGNLIADGINFASDALTNLNNFVSSGELSGNLAAYFGQFAPYGEDIKNVFSLVTSEIGGFFDSMGVDVGAVWDRVKLAGSDAGSNIKDSIGEAIDFVKRRFQLLPTEARAVAQRVGVELALLESDAKIIAAAVVDAFKIQFEYLVSIAVATGRQIADALNVINGDSFDFQGALDSAAQTAADKQVDSLKKAADALKNNQTVREVSIGIINEERDAAVASFDAQIKAADKLREAKEKEATGGKDALGGLGFGGAVSGIKPKASKHSSGGGGGGRSSADTEFSRRQSEFEQLQELLKSEEELISESFQKRLALSQQFTTGNTAERAAMLQGIFELHEEDSARAAQQAANKASTEIEALVIEEEMIRASYEQRKNEILNLTGITEDQRANLIISAEQSTLERTKALQAQRNGFYLQQADSFFGNLTSLASSQNRTLAGIGKAAAIAQTTIKTYEAATSAYAALAGIPYVGPALGVAAASAAIAAGLANVSAIRSTSYAGAYEHGGFIPAGQEGIANEAGFERITGPAVVTSARTTADQLQGSNRNSKMGGDMIVNIKNYSGEKVTEREKTTEKGKELEVIIGEVDKRLAANMRQGKGNLTEATQSSFNLRR